MVKKIIFWFSFFLLLNSEAGWMLVSNILDSVGHKNFEAMRVLGHVVSSRIKT